MAVEKREQAVGHSDTEDDQETEEAKAKHLAHQEVIIRLVIIPLDKQRIHFAVPFLNVGILPKLAKCVALFSHRVLVNKPNSNALPSFGKRFNSYRSRQDNESKVVTLKYSFFFFFFFTKKF